MKHKLCLLWSWVVMLLTDCLRDVPSLMRFRGWLLGAAMRERGRNFLVGAHVFLKGLENLSVGAHVYLAPGVVILSGADVRLDDEVMIAYYSVISSGDHSKRDGSYRFGAARRLSVKIGKGTWIGANSTIVAGVHIGVGVLVGANSVVTKDVPDHAVVGGSAAKVIRLEAEPRD